MRAILLSLAVLLEGTGMVAASVAPPLRAVDGRLDDFVAQRAFPGGVLAVGQDGALVHLHAFGHLDYEPGSPPVREDTLYDLASLTKVVATTTMAMMLFEEGRLDLDAPVSRFVPEFHGGAKDRVTVRQLLDHSAGLEAWAPLYEEAAGPDAYVGRIAAMDLAYAPGTQSLYSDLGAILLGAVLERVAGEPLERFAGRRIFEPLGMTDTLFCPDAERAARTAPTEVDPARGGVLRGVVHDENAYAMGGAAPQAGLFSTAPDLARFAQMLLDGGRANGQRLLSADTIDRFTRRSSVPGSSRALGWDTPSEVSSGGTRLSARAFGHTGFTGTSLWLDPEQRRFVILLTNRVHPTRENDAIRAVRPAVMDGVARALACADTSGARPCVRTGLDVVEAQDGGGLRGRRVGLVAQAASVDLAGRSALDVLRGAGVAVVRLFGPEHGLSGTHPAGEAVPAGVDAASGLPIVSLFGRAMRPARRDLADLDALVFDLQDAGVRFYTYMSTLILCLDAAADAGVELVVLDRPNPLGGERVEGPAREGRPRDRSLLSLAPGPLVHGLTVGEMARYVNAQRRKRARLTVVPMQGWKREMTWAATGRAWIAPSPNLRTAEAALVYPGVALLEATNVSEGRGTESPFLLIGAPWLDARAAIPPMAVPGVALSPARFVPRASTAAPDPKYADRECAGIRLSVLNASVLQPYALGISMLRALRRQPAFRLVDKGAALDRLLGTPRPRQALERGEDADALAADDAPALARWRRERRSVLLY